MKYLSMRLLPLQSYFLFVLLENVQLVPQLLRSLQGHGQKQEDIIHPGNHTVCLVPVKPDSQDK